MHISLCSTILFYPWKYNLQKKKKISLQADVLYFLHGIVRGSEERQQREILFDYLGISKLEFSLL